jgi:hypothetical protein
VSCALAVAAAKRCGHSEAWNNIEPRLCPTFSPFLRPVDARSGSFRALDDSRDHVEPFSDADLLARRAFAAHLERNLSAVVS